MTLRLYSYWRSSCSYRVRVALAMKGLAYETVAVHLRRGEQKDEAYTGKNPMAQVPTLEWEGADGAPVRLTQSMAILLWLDQEHPSPPLLASDPLERAAAVELAEMVNSGIQPLQNFAVLGMVSALGGDREEWCRTVIAKGFAGLEARMAQTAGRFAVGDEPGLADLFLVPQMYNARRFGVDLAGCPTLVRVDAEACALPAFQAAHPDRQPDAEPDAP